MQRRKAVIIGSGVAGMASAIRLAVQGFEVSVYEKNNKPGGKLTWFEQDGYKFDAGPSLFTQPSNVEKLFELANEPIEKYFSYVPVQIACKYFFENGKIINAYSDKEKFASELAQKVNENPTSVKKYLSKAEVLYEKVGNIFLNFSLHKRKTWLNKRILKALLAVRLSYLFKTLHKYNRKCFSANETVQLFDRFATYNGSDPYKAPAMLSLIPHLEQNKGAFYPKGGMISITNGLYNLGKAKGVYFHFNTAVDKIEHDNKNIQGVFVNGTHIKADIVISNVDVYFTYQKLLNHPAKAKKLLRQERSSSAIIFYWGIKTTFPELNLHNIFFSADYPAEFDNIFNKRNIIDDPTVYINITSKMELSQAPEGKENWFVMINVPANIGQNWEELKAKARKNIISKINRILKTDIEQFIETENTLDPVSIENQTSSFMGSLYGTSSNSKLAAFLRQPNFTDAIKGLYFCGGSVHPGGGIPLCLKSAKIVSELIKQQKD